MTDEEFVAKLEPFAALLPEILPSQDSLVRRVLGQEQVYGMSPQPPCAGATGNVLQDMVPYAETVDEPSLRWCGKSVNVWKDNWARSTHPDFHNGRNFLLEDSTGGGFMNIHWDNITQFLGPRLSTHFKLVMFPRSFNFGTDRVWVLEKTSGSGTDRVWVLALHFYQSGIIGY